MGLHGECGCACHRARLWASMPPPSPLPSPHPRPPLRCQKCHEIFPTFYALSKKVRPLGLQPRSMGALPLPAAHALHCPQAAVWGVPGRAGFWSGAGLSTWAWALPRHAAGCAAQHTTLPPHPTPPPPLQHDQLSYAVAQVDFMKERAKVMAVVVGGGAHDGGHALPGGSCLQPLEEAEQGSREGLQCSCNDGVQRLHPRVDTHVHASMCKQAHIHA